ncbi:TPA: hypothetical protein ACH3X1_001723 [Trebouxia sp. C0004]
MPFHLPRQIRRALESLHFINTAGLEWKTFNAAQKQARRVMMPLYQTKRPLLAGHFSLNASEHSFGPMFVVQMVEIVYLIYCGRYFYPVLVVLLFTISAVLLIHTLRRQRKKIRALVNECRLTPLVWDGWVRAISSHRLLPGDVMVLQPGKALCDMILLQGTCLVTESMLSGEAAQVRKSNYVLEKGIDYDPDKNHTCTVYAGTVVQQVWNSQEEVLVMVVRSACMLAQPLSHALAATRPCTVACPALAVQERHKRVVFRTGLNTTMGSMVRELLAPTKRSMKSDPFLADVFHLYAFALVLQILIHIPYFAKAATFQQTPHDVLRKIIDMILYAVPVGVPTVMLLIGRIAYQRLAKERIALTFPESLKVGALADVVCFDKTGTLTHSVTELAGVLPVHKGEFQAIQQSALRWSNRLKQAVAVCNSLTMVNKNTVVGVDMERAMFKAVEARFLDREHVVLPRQPDHTSEALLAKLSIAKVMDFTSQTLRSGVVVWSDDGPRGSALLFLKGAPAMIRDLVQPNTVPQDFNQVMDDYSNKSFRLLAMAVGLIPNATSLDFAMMTQQQVEACAVHMQLLSLVVLTNNVRPDSKDTIAHLQDGGGLRTVMITGDYHHTAVAVARQVEMVKPDGQVVVVDAAPKEMPHQDQSAVQTPEVGSSAASSPLSTPQLSIGRRDADFAHGFFAQSFKPGPAVSVSEASPAKRASVERAQPSRVSWEEQQPSRLSVEGLPKKALPFKAAPAPKQPMEAANVHMLRAEAVSSERPPKIRLSFEGMPSANKAAAHKFRLPPIKAANSQTQGPTQVAQSKAKIPIEASLHSSPSRRQLVKAASLTSLPSQTATSMAAAHAESCSQHTSSSKPASQGLAELGHRMLQASVSRITRASGHPWDSADDPTSDPCHSHWPALKGLVFTSGTGSHHVMEPCEAITSMTEGGMQSAVTGDALEYMLRMHDVSLLEAVMRNAVVFSRMQPHQKGQVMDLLGTRGIHQQFQGQPRHIQGLGNTTIFCGDGINDLAALSAADVGMSVSATDAVIAAALSTTKGSVSGVCSFIRTGKASQAMMVSLFKYMVVCQCVLAIVNVAAFCVDGSSTSNLQSGAIDAQAISLALAACLVPPLAKLNRQKPAERMCTVTALARIFWMAVALGALDMSYSMYLVTRPWFAGGTGTAYMNPVITLGWFFGNLQLLAPLVSLTIDTKPYCESPLNTKPLLIMSVVLPTLAYLVVLVRTESVWNPLQFFSFSQSFRLQCAGLSVAGTVFYAVFTAAFRWFMLQYDHRKLSPT